MAASGKGGNGGGKGGGNGDGTGGTVLRGGRGDDTFVIGQKGVSVAEKPNAGIDSVVASVDYWLDPNVENLTFAEGGDFSGGGNELDNTISGNSGNNTLSGLNGNDILFGGAGDDILIGDAGSDQIDGGDGNDGVQYSGNLADYSFLAQDGYLYVTSADGDTDRLSGVEVLTFADKSLLVQDLLTPEPPPNAAPVAVDDHFTASSAQAFDGTASVLDNDSDADGDPLTIAGFDATSSGGGSVQMHSDGTFSYTAATGFSGTDTFGYTIDDGHGGTSSATVSIEVAGAEAPPTETPYYVTGMIRGDDYRFNPGDPVGTAVTITFAFAEATPDYYSSGHFAWSDFDAFSEEMRDITRQALSQISEFANITFVETSVEDAGMVFGMADILGSARGVAYYPDAYTVGAPSGDVWIDTSLSGLSFDPGTLEYKTLVHEIGHSLGLQHPILPLDELSRQYTVMSDYEHPTFDGEPGSMLLYDVAALQHLYGANDTATSGDDVYTFDDLAETSTAIWDSGGHDTLDLSAATHGVDIDLRQGSFSTVAAAGSNNVAIAFGTQIEDAFGSAYADIVLGNELDNHIFGGDGDDELAGGDGADIFGFAGASGSDRIADFVTGQDKLAFTGPETSIEDFVLTLQENGILVEHSGGSVVLEGVEELDESDLLFGFV